MVFLQSVAATPWVLTINYGRLRDVNTEIMKSFIPNIFTRESIIVTATK